LSKKEVLLLIDCQSWLTHLLCILFALHANVPLPFDAALPSDTDVSGLSTDSLIDMSVFVPRWV